MNTKRIVITGGPGTGKTTLIEELEKTGFFCFEEIIRNLTKAAKSKESSNIFKSNPIASVSDPMAFNTLILQGRIDQFAKASEHMEEIVFYDRGIPDVLAYMDYFKQSYGDKFINACQNYRYDNIFLLPPWEAIYSSDNERLESFEEAKEIHNQLEKTYTHYGYQPIIVPPASIEERKAFVLKLLK